MYILPLEEAAIDKNEVLRYLGYSGQELSDELDRQIDYCIEKAVSCSKPKCVYTVSDIERKQNGVQADGVFLTGNDIKNLLKDCRKAVIFAVTLGIEIDNEIRLLQQLDPVLAVMLNSAAAALIEAHCDIVQKRLMQLSRAVGMTRRYSCGYGDLPLSLQPQILQALNAQRLIGLTVSEGGFMLPKKSVTAVFGLCEKSDENSTADCKNKCSHCSNYNCAFRRN